MVDLYSELQKAVETPLSLRIKQPEFYVTIGQNDGDTWHEFSQYINFVEKKGSNGTEWIGMDTRSGRPFCIALNIRNRIGILAGWKITRINSDTIDGVKIKQQKKKGKK